MSDEEIVEEQGDDVRELIEQIRRCGTLFYESELSGPHFAYEPEIPQAHANTDKLPDEVIKSVDVHVIFKLLQEHEQLPSLQHCTVCDKDVGVILPCKPTPLRAQLDTVCDQCREYMRCGIIMIEIKDKGVRGKGWCVTNEACILHMYKNEPDMMNTILKERGVFIYSEDWTALCLPRGKYENSLPAKFQPIMETQSEC